MTVVCVSKLAGPAQYLKYTICNGTNNESQYYFLLTNLHMPVDQPVELEIFIIITERIDELFCDLEQTHVKEELKDGIDWNVKVNVQRHSPTPHVVALFDGVALLSTDYSEYEKDISGQGDDLYVKRVLI